MEKIDSFNSPNDDLNEKEIQKLFEGKPNNKKIVIDNPAIQEIMKLAINSNLCLKDVVNIIHAYLYLSTGNIKKAKKCFPLKKRYLLQLDDFSNAKVALLILAELIQRYEDSDNC